MHAMYVSHWKYEPRKVRTNKHFQTLELGFIKVHEKYCSWLASVCWTALVRKILFVNHHGVCDYS